MANIIVVGYPKSGTTWVTRLAAELAGCPSAGHWRADHAEMATEGLDRESDDRCWKSHRQRRYLGAGADDRVVYVVRDPRDVVVSGANYFYFERWPHAARAIDTVPKLRGLYDRVLYDRVTPESFRLERMIDAVTIGADVHEYTAVSWAEHVRAYRESGAHHVRYEDLLADPLAECRRLVDFLGVEPDEVGIADAVARQSFDVRRDGFRNDGDEEQARFLRAGRSEQWRSALDASQVARVEAALGADLAACGYPVGA